MSTSRPLFVRAAALTAGALAALALSEIILRPIEARRAKKVSGGSLSLLMPNPRGSGSYRLKPHLNETAEVEGRTIAIRTNRFGMRWRDVDKKKRPGVKRLAVFGDSFAFGCWSNSIEESFTGIVDRELAPGGIEVLNFGAGGYGVADEELLLEEEVLGFEPDAVLIVMFNGNDFRDTYLGLDRESLINGAAILNEAALKAKVPPRFLVKGRPPLVPLAPERWWERAFRHLALFRMAAPLFDLDSPWIDFAQNRDFRSYGFWSSSPYPDVAIEARDATLAALDRIHERLLGLGIGLYVAAIPTSEQVYAVKMTGPGYDLSLPQRFVAAHAAAHGIPFLDLLPALRDFARASGWRPYLRRDTHLNNRGHALVGLTLARWLREQSPPPTGIE